MPQSVLKWNAVCGISCSVCPRNATHRVLPLSNWQRNATAAQMFKPLWHSAFKRTAECHNPPYTFEHGMYCSIRVKSSPAILHCESPCLKRHIFLTRDFQSIKYIHGRLFRLILYTNGLSWCTFLVTLSLKLLSCGPGRPAATLYVDRYSKKSNGSVLQKLIIFVNIWGQCCVWGAQFFY
jgi:hypothetical protein